MKKPVSYLKCIVEFLNHVLQSAIMSVETPKSPSATSLLCFSLRGMVLQLACSIGCAVGQELYDHKRRCPQNHHVPTFPDYICKVGVA